MSKILIVEDNKSLREQFSESLERKKVEYVLCEDFECLVKIISDDNQISIIILDLHLPDHVDPKEMIKKIQDINGRIKICIYTAMEDLMSKEDAIRMGAQFYWNKEVDINELLYYVLGEVYVEKVDSLNNIKLLKYVREVIGFEITEDIEMNRAGIKNISENIYKKILRDSGRDVGVYGEAVHRVMGMIMNLDMILFLNKKRYRDHYKHQMAVGLFGIYLLDSCVTPGREKLIDYILSLKKYSGLKKSDIYLAWWIAAMFHDFAYPISYLLTNVDQIRKIKNEYSEDEGGIKDIFIKYMDFYKSYFTGELLTYFIESYEKDMASNIRTCIEHGLDLVFQSSYKNDVDMRGNLLGSKESLYDHGVIGSAILAQNIKQEKIDAVMRMALKAMALHNNKNNIIKFDDEPIAALLVLCDELQEWERDVYVDGEVLNEFKYIEIKILDNEYNNRAIGKRLCVTFNCDDVDIIERTGWNYDMFIKNKKSNIKRIIGWHKLERIEIKTTIIDKISIE
jgi:CheY-like chemotaxis protein